MDQLQRMAKAQGKTDLMKEIRTDEQKCKKVLQKYAELTGDDGTGSKKKARLPHSFFFKLSCYCRIWCNYASRFLFVCPADTLFGNGVTKFFLLSLPPSWQVPKGTLLQSLEKHVATSRVMFNTEMVMMTEGYWVKHATETLTELQGRLTAFQAQAKWFLGSSFWVTGALTPYT